jgi:hypothetical protein
VGKPLLSSGADTNSTAAATGPQVSAKCSSQSISGLPLYLALCIPLDKMESLPTELLATIFAELNPFDSLRACLVSTQWCTLLAS